MKNEHHNETSKDAEHEQDEAVGEPPGLAVELSLVIRIQDVLVLCVVRLLHQFNNSALSIGDSCLHLQDLHIALVLGISEHFSEYFFDFLFVKSGLHVGS